MGRSVADGAPRVCARLDSTGVRDARVHPSREASGVVVVVAASERASEEGLVIYPRVVVEEEAARGIDATRQPHRIHSLRTNPRRAFRAIRGAGSSGWVRVRACGERRDRRYVRAIRGERIRTRDATRCVTRDARSDARHSFMNARMNGWMRAIPKCARWGE